jgi:hypothetical protein
MSYAAPVDGTLHLPRCMRTLVYDMRFDDHASPSACSIRFRVRRTS